MDVGLSEDEWLSGVEFLTEAGHITDEQRQEFSLNASANLWAIDAVDWENSSLTQKMRRARH